MGGAEYTLEFSCLQYPPAVPSLLRAKPGNPASAFTAARPRRELSSTERVSELLSVVAGRDEL